MRRLELARCGERGMRPCRLGSPACGWGPQLARWTGASWGRCGSGASDLHYWPAWGGEGRGQRASCRHHPLHPQRDIGGAREESRLRQQRPQPSPPPAPARRNSPEQSARARVLARLPQTASPPLGGRTGEEEGAGQEWGRTGRARRGGQTPAGCRAAGTYLARGGADSLTPPDARGSFMALSRPP